MRGHTVDYRAQEDTPPRGRLFDRGFWINDIPRPLLTCRTFGHKPVVDGFGDGSTPGHTARWVVCDRCGERPNPQGALDPAEWSVGDAYTGPWTKSQPVHAEVLKAQQARGEATVGPHAPHPGPWPANPTWTFSGQAILGKNIPGASIEAKVGNSGSEEPIAAHIRIHPIGALYLGANTLGRGLQRRLNPTGYESRVIGVDIDHNRLTWQLWARRDHWSRSDPRWQQGSINLDVATKLFGQKRYWFTDEGDPVEATVRLPHGDDHTVTLQLQRCEFGREKLRRRELTWTVDWDKQGGGIPTEPGGRGRVSGFHIDVSAASVRNGTWPLEAAAAIAKTVTAMRTREGMNIPAEVA
ncbi:hypothetical protein BJF79_03715 [Actinomadura sp. CNU-125]|uniref:hypothetical protein n=1 Tax=Actinomadura sp. CNU-125 TaxID=1904961 RepID=UPI0009600B31|nr:hypothetical protein [Actinomadura sp. CNU-125]OLT13017.1 hypothetical protein BJF79_03715 [Actinomadura sp. CNU-125]